MQYPSKEVMSVPQGGKLDLLMLLDIAIIFRYHVNEYGRLKIGLWLNWADIGSRGCRGKLIYARL